MTLKTLASAIAKLEGKKSQARIADVREIIKILRHLISEDLSILELLKPKKRIVVREKKKSIRNI